jgi:hypothetical protein
MLGNERRVYSDIGVISAGLAAKSMARAIIASTYIRQLRSGLPRCCLHGRSRQFAMRTHSHTSDLPDTPDWGVETQRTVDVIA